MIEVPMVGKPLKAFEEDLLFKQLLEVSPKFKEFWEKGFIVGFLGSPLKIFVNIEVTDEELSELRNQIMHVSAVRVTEE